MRVALEDSDPQAVTRYEHDRNEARLQRIALKDPRRAEELRREWAQEQGEQKRHSGEYGSLIIHSIETGQPRVIYGNVGNDDLISNLPHGCCVEVPCLVDKNGVQP